MHQDQPLIGVPNIKTPIEFVIGLNSPQDEAEATDFRRLVMIEIVRVARHAAIVLLQKKHILYSVLGVGVTVCVCMH